MNFLNKHSFISVVTVFVLVLSFLFCCGASWHNILFGADNSMSEHSACGMGDVGNQDNSAHVSFTVTSIITFLQNFTALFVIIIIALLPIILSRRLSYFWFYIKMIKDHYGGFRFFDDFINLFRLGILHPKTF